MSTVPWTIRVGMRMWATSAPGPRAANHGLLGRGDRSGPRAAAARPRGPSGSTWSAGARELSSPDQPILAVAALSRLVTSECQAMVGTMASTRQSVAAVTSWMPPP